jgi:hypothetical protein
MAPGRLEMDMDMGKYLRAISILATRRENGTPGIRISTFMKVQCALRSENPAFIQVRGRAVEVVVADHPRFLLQRL